ncbi:MAG: protein-glutamate O-methyltransferase CheR, partial [Planctomycetota bacterium]
MDIYWKELQNLFENLFGYHFSDSQQKEVFQKLEKIFNHLGISSIEEGIKILLHENSKILEEPAWKEAFLQEFTVGETYFYREPKVWQFLKNVFFPKAYEERKNLKNPPPLRIWSAACATGEEAYSLAITAHSLGWKVKEVEIYGTDINPFFLEKAKKGIYRPWSFRKLPDSWNPYFKAIPSDSEGSFLKKVSSFLKEYIQFQELNLCQLPYPSPYHNPFFFDLILCRNLFIYFSPTKIQEILQAFYKALKDGGYLILGGTENLLGISHSFALEFWNSLALYKKDMEKKKKAKTSIELPLIPEEPSSSSFSLLDQPKSSLPSSFSLLN